jgi:Putative zincin peptidase
MFIPGIVISLLTFPGVIVHELAHQLFCRWCKVPVFKVVYFQFENPVGYVLHEIPSSKWHSILISIGPFILNSIVGALIAFPAALPVFKFDNGGPLDYLLIYLGVSIAMHAFPSTGDANAIWEHIKDKKTSLPVKIFGFPIVGLIYLGSLGSFFWLDLLYGIGIAIGLPNLVIALLA